MSTKEKRVGLGLVILIGVVAFLTFAFQKPDSFRGTLYDPAQPAPEITLIRADGQPFRLSAEKGKLVFLFFGYTSCPDVCPTTMAEMRQVGQAVGAKADQFDVVFVTVDPNRDTPEKVQKYVSVFDPGFIGLSGSMDELQLVWDKYGVYRQVEASTSPTDYAVTHSSRLYLVDRQGNLRLSYAFGTSPDDIAYDVQLLLAE
jgi:protein SCO1/2